MPNKTLAAFAPPEVWPKQKPNPPSLFWAYFWAVFFLAIAGQTMEYVTKYYPIK